MKLNSSVTQHNDGCALVCLVSLIVGISCHVPVMVEFLTAYNNSNNNNADLMEIK